MRVTHPDLWCDLGDHLLAAELGLGIRQPLDDRPSVPHALAPSVSRFPDRSVGWAGGHDFSHGIVWPPACH